MQDLDPVAKRIYNVAPEPVTLTLADGASAVYHLSSAEFFQREFRAEGTREGDDADYRLVTGDDDRSVLLGRRGPDDDGWTVVGEVVAAERAGGDEGGDDGDGDRDVDAETGTKTETDADAETGTSADAETGTDA